jgi:hypothetical protein
MQLSGILGLYNQSPEEDYIAVNGKNLSQESASHYILSASYDFNGRVLKSEIYYKDYSKLALTDNAYYTSKGHGYSKELTSIFWMILWDCTPLPGKLCGPMLWNSLRHRYSNSGSTPSSCASSDTFLRSILNLTAFSLNALS